MTTVEIRSIALNLPAAERAALAHDLIASLDAEDPDPRADALWAAEIERRAHEVADGSCRKAPVMPNSAQPVLVATGSITHP